MQALGRGMPAREAELARGFVLGDDEGIDAETVEDFRRAGLSHLLAVSGQNVALLALLAMPVLALLGLPLRARLAWVLGLIVVYVPLAGAGPSIQRAGVMGALSVLATLRRAARLAPLRAGGRGGGHARDRPRDRRRRRLAAELRRRPRDPLPGGADGGRDRRAARRPGPLGAALAEGIGDDRRRDAWRPRR